MGKKIDYEDIEHKMESGISRMVAEQMLFYADIAAFTGTKSMEDSYSKGFKSHNRIVRFARTRWELQRLSKKNKALLSNLGVPIAEIKRLFTDSKKLKPADWEKIGEIQIKLKELKQEHSEEIDDEELVEDEWRKDQKRRFNVNEDWLQL